MSDDVKFIFKTLIKIPVIVVISYLILNIVMFINFYFKGLGDSYLLMQTVAINNYLPLQEQQNMQSVGENLMNYSSDGTHSAFVDRVVMGYSKLSSAKSDYQIRNEIVNAGDLVSIEYPTDAGRTGKYQYGTAIQCYLAYRFIWQMPLAKDGEQGLSVDGLGNNTDANSRVGGTFYLGNGDTTELGVNNMSGDNGAIIIYKYVVPALKYYPDLAY